MRVRKKQQMLLQTKKLAHLSRSELFKSLKFINLVLEISKSKKNSKVSNEYKQKLKEIIR